MRRLNADAEVEPIVVVSKPPDDDVATEPREYAARWDRSDSPCSAPDSPT